VAGFEAEDHIERVPYSPEVEHKNRRVYILAIKPERRASLTIAAAADREGRIGSACILILNFASYTIRSPSLSSSRGRNKKGHWIWRCHIDLSHPHRKVGRFLQVFVNRYDAAIFSSPSFAGSSPSRNICSIPRSIPFRKRTASSKRRWLTKVFIGFGDFCLGQEVIAAVVPRQLDVLTLKEFSGHEDRDRQDDDGFFARDVGRRARGIDAQLAVVEQRPEGADQQVDLARGLLGHPLRSRFLDTLLIELAHNTNQWDRLVSSVSACQVPACDASIRCSVRKMWSARSASARCVATAWHYPGAKCLRQSRSNLPI
jgi:hypothetical protein